MLEYLEACVYAYMRKATVKNNGKHKGVNSTELMVYFVYLSPYPTPLSTGSILPRCVKTLSTGILVSTMTKPLTSKHKTRTKLPLNKTGPKLYFAFISLINSTNHSNDGCSRTLGSWGRG